MEFIPGYEESDANYVDDPVLGVAGAPAGNVNQDPGVGEQQPDADSKEGDALLVSLVEGYPILYDKSLADHKNGNMRESCWMQIGNIMELPAWDCAKRWAQLRESFCREKRKRAEESRSGSGASKRKGFSLFEDMRFLENHVTKRKTFSNVAPASQFSTSCTPMLSLPLDQNIQASRKYMTFQPNMPRTSTNNRRVTSSPIFSLATLNPSPRFNTLPPTPTPPLDIRTETCSPQTPTAWPPMYIPITPSPESTCSSLGPISPLVAYPSAIDQSPTPSYLGSDSQLGIGNASRKTFTPQMTVENDIDRRSFPRPHSSLSWRNDNTFRESPSPPCKLAKPNACYKKELNKPKKIDPIESSFMSLSSAIQNHLTNPIRGETEKKGVSSSDVDDLFGTLIANELKKLEEPAKTAKKARLLQVIYELEPSTKLGF